MEYLDISDISQEQFDLALYDFFIHDCKTKIEPLLDSMNCEIDSLTKLYNNLKSSTLQLDEDSTVLLCDKVIHASNNIIRNARLLKGISNWRIEEPSQKQQESSTDEQIYDLYKLHNKKLSEIANEFGMDVSKVQHIFVKESRRRFLLKTSKVYRALVSASRIIEVDNAFVNRIYGILKRAGINEAIERGGSFDSYTDQDLLEIYGIGKTGLILIRVGQKYLDSVKYFRG